MHTIEPTDGDGDAGGRAVQPTVLDQSGLVVAVKDIVTGADAPQAGEEWDAAAVTAGQDGESVVIGWRAQPCHDHPVIVVEGEPASLRVTIYRGPEPEGVECTADLQSMGVVLQLREPVDPVTVETSVKDGASPQ